VFFTALKEIKKFQNSYQQKGPVAIGKYWIKHRVNKVPA
tara:strand:+ start:248 stop:364 length:117 start_codon:yes stop_codon:yes gene_type:complete